MTRRALAVMVCLVVLALASASATAAVVSRGYVEDAFWDEAQYHRQYNRYLKRKIHAAKRALSDRAEGLARNFTPSVASCNTCKTLTQIVVDVVLDPALDNVTRAVLAGVCSKITNTSAAYQLCVSIADVADYIAVRALKELHHLGWNVPVSVCADVLPLCQIDCCLSNTTAEQFHLAFVDTDAVTNATFLSVMWTMRHFHWNVTLQWRSVDAASGAVGAWFSAEGVSADSYRVGGWLGWNYRAIMGELTADTTYEYRVVDGDAPVSPVHTTRTLPLNLGAPERPMRVLALADMGWHAVSNDTVARMTGMVERGEVDFVIHYGDLGYADGNEEDWDLFMRKIEPIASRVPYMTTPGNHECLWNFTAYRSRLTMIHTPHQLNGSMWYTFRAGGVSFVMLDSESWIDTPQMQSEQVWWVGEVLANASLRREGAIVTLHRPLYCTSPGSDCGVFAELLRDALESTVNQPNVLMVQAGHLHSYERTLPVYQGRVATHNLTNPQSPVYIVNGAAGNKEGQSGFGKAQPWTASRTSSIGFASMTFTSTRATGGDTTLVAKTMFYDSASGAVVDAFNLTKLL